MIKLHTGLWTNKQFAEWKGIKQTSIKTHKQNYLEQLKEFADFHLDGRKVIIDKVKEDTYEPKRRRNINVIKARVPSTWNKNGYDTKARVSKDIHRQLDKENINLPIADSTFYKNTCIATWELYGKPFEAAGERGSSIAVLCKKVKDDSEDGYHIEPLTEKETKIEDQLFTLYYGKDSQKAKLLIEMAKDGEFPKEELYDRIDEQTNLTSDEVWVQFLVDLRAKTGAEIVRATLVKENEQSVF